VWWMIGKVAGSLSSSLEVTLLLLTYSSGCIQNRALAEEKSS
jgi:hypothetical protein